MTGFSFPSKQRNTPYSNGGEWCAAQKKFVRQHRRDNGLIASQSRIDGGRCSVEAVSDLVSALRARMYRGLLPS